MAERILVPFEGVGAGVAELSWGQREIWSVMRLKGHSLTIGGVRSLPSGSTVCDVVDDLGFIMARHQSLRTRLRFGADGAPLQVVSDRGALPSALAVMVIQTHLRLRTNSYAIHTGTG